MMGVIPAEKSALTLRFTVSLVSPKYSRRSEWPTTQYAQPASTSILAETSPV